VAPETAEQKEQIQTQQNQEVSQTLLEPWRNLKDFFVEPDVLKLIPKPVAVKHTLLPLFLHGEVLHISMANPKDLTAIDEIRRSTKVRAIIPHASSKEDLLESIDRNYGSLDNVHDIVQEIEKEKMEQGVGFQMGQQEDLAAIAEQAPIIKLVNHVIMQAIHEKISDIHFEPDEKLLRVRFRKDGVLQENHQFQKELESAILARVKIISGMDIAEKRKPQDGRIKIVLESKKIDIRVSSLPTLYGENIVLRLLDKSVVSPKLEDGPTGSGKSTTLFAGLSEINDMEKNIVTIEDPIEYDMHLIRQTQVNPKIGLTFATGLRSILRQDPDVVMVGEIRDKETAEIAIQAALTGHLVLSTLHTNDACGAITRLIDMGIPPYLIASSVVGVLAQRLVRKLCENCKQPIEVPDTLVKELGVSQKKPVFYEGKGCKQCRDFKYAGRTSIHELVVVTDSMRELITRQASEAELSAQARKQGMKDLRESGVEKALRGVTSLEEVLKATRINME